MKELSVTPPPQKEPPEETKPVPVVNSTPKTEEKVEKSETDRPFSAEYFDVPEWGKLLLEPKMDSNSLVQKLIFVDDYLTNQLKNNSMKADRDSIHDILFDIERSLNLDRKHDLAYRISRVYGFLNVIKMTKEREELRRNRLLSILKK